MKTIFLIICFSFLHFGLSGQTKSGVCKKSGATSPITFDKVTISKETENAIRKLVKEHKKLEAIKVLRQECKDMGLKENKDLVESMQ